MRVVSLVPSWTETLLEAGIEVAGRTRYCIHPKESVASIPRVGGTKDWNWPRILELKPDLLILDKEENPKFMAEQSEIPYWASHITSVADVAPALTELSAVMGSSRLGEISEEWRNLPPARPAVDPLSLEFPGVLEWGRRPSHPVTHVIYVIWRDPWMAAAPGTFIGSVLRLCGLGPWLKPFAERYPVFRPTELDPERTLLLFSSEPYPFLRRKAEAAELGFPHAFVDGESFSWFGVRSLRFLQRGLSRTALANT